MTDLKIRMNLEVELLKKDIQNLKTEMQALRYHILSEQMFFYYKITILVIHDSPFHVQNFIKTIKETFKDSTLHYKYTLSEDMTFYTPLLPDLHVFHTNVSIYLHLNKPQLPQYIKDRIEYPSKLHEFKKIETYTLEMSKESNLILYNDL